MSHLILQPGIPPDRSLAQRLRCPALKKNAARSPRSHGPLPATSKKIRASIAPRPEPGGKLGPGSDQPGGFQVLTPASCLKVAGCRGQAAFVSQSVALAYSRLVNG